MERIFFFHNNFLVHIQNDSLLFFFMPCQYFQNNEWKKISKFEREDKSNGNPLVHHAIFIFLHKNFPLNMKNDSLLFFFLYTCSYFYNNECTYVNTQKYELSTISGRSTMGANCSSGSRRAIETVGGGPGPPINYKIRRELII